MATSSAARADRIRRLELAVWYRPPTGLTAAAAVALWWAYLRRAQRGDP
jgi:hypothetical protein